MFAMVWKVFTGSIFAEVDQPHHNGMMEAPNGGIRTVKQLFWISNESGRKGGFVNECHIRGRHVDERLRFHRGKSRG